MKTTKLSAVKKFYLLDYFYVLLKSIEQFNDETKVFQRFISLKQQYKLGESKYRRLTQDTDEISKTQKDRFYYTFTQVLYEAKLYNLIRQNDEELLLTDIGKEALSKYLELNPQLFYLYLFRLMEQNYLAFSYFINFFNRASKDSNGLIILPMYSPLKLNLERRSIVNTQDLETYFECLKNRLEQDIKNLLKQNISLTEANQILLDQLFSSKIIGREKTDAFNPKKYNAILNRVRKYWQDYFLKKIYGFSHSLQSFEIWTYRGKQIGILHATEFFPNFSGKLIYPTSIIKESTASKDFTEVFKYERQSVSLYIHNPSWRRTQDEFLDALTLYYFKIRKKARSVFINLNELKELVCFKLRINEYTFRDFLEEAYHLNIVGQLRINISLEADKLPEETNAMYLKREPVLVDGKNRNIIAIDVTKGRK